MSHSVLVLCLVCPLHRASGAPMNFLGLSAGAAAPAPRAADGDGADRDADPLRAVPRAAAGPWLPLESNPDVLNPFLRKLGCPKDWSFCDVFGLDPELLMMVPRPCVALCLLFPCDKISTPRRAELRAKRGAPLDAEAGLFFTQQLDGCGNACGTIACMHALGNAAAAGAFALDDGSLLGRFVAETAGSSAPDRGAALLLCGGARLAIGEMSS